MGYELQKLAMGSIARWLINLVCVWRVALNIDNNGHEAEFILFGIGALATLGWSLIQKFRTVFVIDEALRLPKKSTFADLNEVIQ